MDAYQLLHAWAENSVTWNTPWSTPGANAVGADRAATSGANAGSVDRAAGPAASGTWAQQSGGYRQSATTNNTNAYRAQAQNQLLVYQWKATYTSGTSAGLYLFASAATGAERGNSYRIWQDATSVKIYENANNVDDPTGQLCGGECGRADAQLHGALRSRDQQAASGAGRRGLGSWIDTTPR